MHAALSAANNCNYNRAIFQHIEHMRDAVCHNVSSIVERNISVSCMSYINSYDSLVRCNCCKNLESYADARYWLLFSKAEPGLVLT
jgi:hypothetical protein